MKKLKRYTIGSCLLLDDEDYDKVNQHNLYWNSRGTVIFIRVNKKDISLGRFLLDYSGPLQVDHIDRNHCNMQKSNLRIVTRQQQSANQGLTGFCDFKGIYKSNKRWGAQIKVNYKHIYLGLHDTQELAAVAYDNAAIKYFGIDYAGLNFPVKK